MVSAYADHFEWGKPQTPFGFQNRPRKPYVSLTKLRRLHTAISNS